MHAFSEPILVVDPEDIAEICRFRAEVWAATGTLRPDAFDDSGWRDPIDEHAFHWTIRDLTTGKLAAAGRLTLHHDLQRVHQADEYLRYGLRFEGPVAAPDRVVVAQDCQGSGLGARIVDLQDRYARALGARVAVRQASRSMAQLIARRGWRLVGPASEDPRFPGAAFTVAYRVLA